MSDVARDDVVMLVHDLRNPLATINVYAQILLQDADAAGNDFAIRTIQEAALRLDGLIGELSALRKPRRASDTRTHAGTDAVELVRSLARGSNRVRVTSQASEIVGRWRRVELERLLANLVDNALKYSPVDRPVEVTVGKADGCLVISIADQGIGIPHADASRVFERGYRATNAKAPTFSGDGLGLATVRRIVDEQHGTISVVSDEGVGTRVTVRLPFVQVGGLAS